MCTQMIDINVAIIFKEEIEKKKSFAYLATVVRSATDRNLQVRTPPHVHGIHEAN